MDKQTQLKDLIQKDKNLTIIQWLDVSKVYLVRKTNPLLGAIKGMTLTVWDSFESDVLHVADLKSLMS